MQMGCAGSVAIAPATSASVTTGLVTNADGKDQPFCFFQRGAWTVVPEQPITQTVHLQTRDSCMRMVILRQSRYLLCRFHRVCNEKTAPLSLPSIQKQIEEWNTAQQQDDMVLGYRAFTTEKETMELLLEPSAKAYCQSLQGTSLTIRQLLSVAHR